MIAASRAATTARFIYFHPRRTSSTAGDLMPCPQHTPSEYSNGNETFLRCRECGARLASEPTADEVAELGENVPMEDVKPKRSRRRAKPA
jgi:hypothetical protein